MGRMGRALACRLLDTGHEVAVWNRTPGRTGSLIAAGAEDCPTIAGAVKATEVVVSSLSTDDAVCEVALGAGGVVGSLDDQLYVDASTISPELSRQLAEACPQFVAMPVAGSPDAVRQGAATYLVGGSEQQVEQLWPMLESLSDARHVYPRPELANVAKLTGNMLLLSAVTALAESIAMARSGGLSDEELRELLETSAMLAPGVKNRLDAVLSGDDAGWWTNELGEKDADLAVRVAAADSGARLPVLTAVRERYAAAIDLGLADSDIATVARLYA
jgi:3-hydroxyisobutyrate dehydrogenase